VTPGYRIRLADGSEAEITSFGAGDPFPIFARVVNGENAGTAMCLWSNELKRNKEREVL